MRTGSPYAVAPGRVRKDDGEPFRVFTPFRRAWAEHGWRGPADTAADTRRLARPGEAGRRPARGAGPRRRAVDADLPEAGEAAALAPVARSSSTARSPTTATARDRPDKAGTSRMSVYLKYGEIHPRTMLADLAPGASESAETYRTEIAWREFYADVLYQRPDSRPPQLRPRLRRAAAGVRQGGRGARSTPGARAAPASRSSTPGCGSCARRRGCTTGCG